MEKQFTANRTVILRATSPQTSTFFEEFKHVFDATRALFNEIVMWEVESVETINGKVDFTKERKSLYKKYGKSWTETEFFEILGRLAKHIRLSPNPGSAYRALFFGGGREERLITSLKSILDVKFTYSKEEKDAGKVPFNAALHGSRLCGSLRQTGFFDRYPFNVKFLNPAESAMVIMNVHNQYASWFDRNVDTNQKYNNKVSEYEKVMDRCPVSHKKELVDFIKFCMESKVITQYNLNFKDWFFLSVIPSLMEGKKESPDVYRKPKSTRDKRYSLDQSFYDYLVAHPKLWNDGGELLKEHFEVLSMRDWLLRHKGSANYPFIGENDFHRFQYMLGNNYVEYDMNYGGEELKDTALVSYRKDKEASKAAGKKVSTMIKETYDGGCTVDRLELEFGKSSNRFAIHTKDVYKNGTINPGQYLKNLSCWKLASGSGTYLLEYDRKRRVRSLLKEPSIVYKDGNFYVRLNLTVQTEVPDEVLSMKYLFSSAYSKTETADNRKRIKDIGNKTFYGMGVDLGLRNPFSYAIAKFSYNNGKCPIEITKSGTYEQKSPLGNEYKNFRSELRTFNRVMAFIKTCHKGKEFEEESDDQKLTMHDFIAQAQLYLSGRTGQGKKKQQQWSSFAKKTPESILSYMKKNSDKDLAMMKVDHNFGLTHLLRFLDYRFSDIRRERSEFLRNKCDGTKIDYEFDWIDCIGLLKRCKRSMSYLGTSNDRTPIEFPHLNEYSQNCKDNLLKHIASNIIQVALDNKCQVIVLEDLENSICKEDNSEHDNNMLALWSPKSIQECIENAAASYGLQVATVSERCTSKIVYETRRFGYRVGANLHYLDDNNKLVTIDADINAAKNIIYRFVKRHTDFADIFLTDRKDEKKVDAEGNVQETGKRAKGFLAFLGTTVKTIADELGVNNNYAYLQDGKWMTYEQRREHEDAIKLIADARGSKVKKAR